MANYDAGHYFLTVLAPISADSVLNGTQSQSPKHLVKDVLAVMPNSERTPASRGNAPGSPFTLSPRTHFARFAVLDDVVFNGRLSGDTLLNIKTDLLAAQPVDSLTTPFLIFVADFDANSGDDAVLRDYTAELWNNLQSDLLKIFSHCVGFDAVTTADAFHQYIRRCQVETSLPFNDYWCPAPPLTDFNIAPYKYPVIAAGGAFALGIVGVLICLAFGLVGHAGSVTGLLTASEWLSIVGLIAAVVIVGIGVKAALAKASQPFPKSIGGPGSDLPTVLKALKLQREFTAFAIAAQGQDEASLHAAFGDFLTRNKPDDLTTATQPPGVIDN